MKQNSYEKFLYILKNIGVIVGFFLLIIILMNSCWIIPRWLFLDSQEKFVIIQQDIYSIGLSILTGIVFVICFILQLHHEKVEEQENKKLN